MAECFPEAGRQRLDSWFCLMLLVPWQSQAKSSAGEWSSFTFSWESVVCVAWVEKRQKSPPPGSQPQPASALREAAIPLGLSHPSAG